jgi:hypothetical protein
LLFNVMEAGWGTRLHVNCATEDGYAVQNLIGTRGVSQERVRGFLPCGFHRPPLFLTIALPIGAKFELYAIRLATVEGSHFTKKVGLFTSGEEVPLPSSSYLPATDNARFRHLGTFDQLQVGTKSISTKLSQTLARLRALGLESTDPPSGMSCFRGRRPLGPISTPAMSPFGGQKTISQVSGPSRLSC